MNEDYVKALQFLEIQQFMTLAVVRENGKPWAVPVRISHRDDMSFYWDSSPETLHSQCIKRTPTVMLSMYRLNNGDIKEFGFHAEATAEPTKALSDGRVRYCATVSRAWINDEQHEKRALDL